MKFSDILEALENNTAKRYARTSWTTNKYIVLMTEQCIDECMLTPITGKVLGVPEHRSFRIKPFLLIKLSDYEFGPFLAGYDDFTATDWQEVI